MVQCHDSPYLSLMLLSKTFRNHPLMFDSELFFSIIFIPKVTGKIQATRHDSLCSDRTCMNRVDVAAASHPGFDFDTTVLYAVNHMVIGAVRSGCCVLCTTVMMTTLRRWYASVLSVASPTAPGFRIVEDGFYERRCDASGLNAADLVRR